MTDAPIHHNNLHVKTGMHQYDQQYKKKERNIHKCAIYEIQSGSSSNEALLCITFSDINNVHSCHYTTPNIFNDSIK